MQKKEAGRKEEGSKEGRERRGRRNTEEVGTHKVLEVEESLWEKGVGKDASAKGLGSRNRVKEGVYPKEREGILIVKRRKRGSTSIWRGSAKEGIYSTIQVTPDIASTFCSKKG